jgi:hypothetical protein
MKFLFVNVVLNALAYLMNIMKLRNMQQCPRANSRVYGHRPQPTAVAFPSWKSLVTENKDVQNETSRSIPSTHTVPKVVPPSAFSRTLYN